MIDFLKKMLHIPKFAHGGMIEKPIVDIECDPPELIVNQERFDEAMEKIHFADIVKVVRCKDCKNSESCNGEFGICNRFRTVINPNGYCSYGERK